VIVAVGLALTDAGSQLAGDTLLPGGPFDECAHLCTCLLVFWALGRPASQRFLASALLASVAIDIDHVPARLGSDWLTAGTPRPYTHSLLTIGVVLVGAVGWRRGRAALLGVAFGLAVHFWRDLSETGSGVALLWPWSDRSFQLPHVAYLAAMAAIVGACAWRSRHDGERPRRGSVANREFSAARL
jgi:hypothetical protein